MKHKKDFFFGFSILFLSVVLLSACEKDDGTDKTPPAPVSDLVAVAANGQVTLSWTEPADVDLDSIEISYMQGSVLVISQVAGISHITVLGLTNGTEYTFAVVSVDEAGNKSQAVNVSAVPRPPFVVVSPDQSNYNPAGGTFSSDGSGHLIITVTFNRPLDVSSVKPAQTIYFEGDAITQGTVEFSNENKTVTFTTTDDTSVLGTFSPDLHFDFVLVGDDAGNGSITDSNGMILDGDENGESGGDYVLHLYIIG